jgi:hypothetical protein
MRHYLGIAASILVTTAVAVVSYSVNMKVSSERAAVTRLRIALVDETQRIRELQAELRTRAALPEMQRWNDVSLHMTAPQATQFLASPVQLAAFAAQPEGDGAAAAGTPALRYAVTEAIPGAAEAAPTVPAVPAPRALVKAAYAQPAPEPELPVADAPPPEVVEGQ